MLYAYKLVRERADGSLGPLFINRKQRLPVGQWLQAECHPTPGYAVRPGWHCCAKPHAPHLSMKGRVWVRVHILSAREHVRPVAQGGLWYTAAWMRIVRVIRKKAQ